MATYVGPATGTSGIVLIPVCFTGWTALLMRSLLLNTEAIITGIGGAIIGLAISMVFGPEVVSKFIGAGIGAFGGVVAGVIIASIFLSMSTCPCPAGSSGFCIYFIVLIAPGTTIGVPMWPFFGPAPGRCTTLMPAGCP